MNLAIRDITVLEEVHAVEQLQKETWGIGELEVVPATQFIAAIAAGGQLIGAWDEQTLVGFAYGLVGFVHGKMFHHSHMLAVKPGYQNLDVGYRLKLAQRERVLAQGIREMNWTFDPLQSRNAHFNFRKLGVTSDSYRIDFYGPETSTFLRELGTDRLWVTWDLTGDRERRASKAAGPLLVEVGSNGAPRQRDFDLRAPNVSIAIPRDINTLSPQLAVQWREATRRAFTAALAEGFVIDDFVDGAYVLTRQDRA